MFNQMQKLREKDDGFTLIELLVVIAIIGILAGVVVFAVQGLGDKGQANACKIDTRTINTAEEAYFTQYGYYATEPKLVADTLTVAPSTTIPTRFLNAPSTLHDVITTGPPAAPTGYNVTIQDAKCGGNDPASVTLVVDPAATPPRY